MKNFGKIKHAYAKVMVEGYIQNDKTLKENYKNFVNTTKGNPILLKQQKIYSLLSNLSEVNDKDGFISECLQMVSNSDRENFILENTKLVKNLFEIGVIMDEKYPNHELDEAITRILYNKSLTTEGIEQVVNAKKIIKEHVSNKSSKPNKHKKSLDNETLVEVFRLKINNTYPDLTETEYQIVESIGFNNTTKQKELFDNLVESCLTKITGLDSQPEYESVVKKLNEMSYNEKTFQADINKLTELEKSLT